MNTNPIVFLPGVFDSRLYFDTELNRLAWPLDDVEIFRGMAMFNGLITLEQERAHVPLYVPEPVNDSTAGKPEYGPNSKWKDFIEGLVAAFPNRDVWYFSYDFRQLSADSAVSLNDFLKTFDTQVDIVCHSYGNNLLAAYLSAYGPDKINRAACLAPPFEGSPEIFLVPPGSPNFPCMNELVPSPEINKIYPVTVRQSPESPAVPADEKAYAQVINSFNGARYVKQDFSALFAHPGIRFALGGDRLTPLATEFTIDEKGLPYVSDFGFGHAGDATVPTLSGSDNGALADRICMFPGLNHSGFASDRGAVFWAVMQLNSNDPPMIPYQVYKRPFVKILVDGSVDVNVHKPFSLENMISLTYKQSAGIASDPIGPERNINVIALDPQECVIELYSIVKRETMKITIETYDADEKLTDIRTETVSSRFVRMIMDKNGQIDRKFTLDLPEKISDIKVPDIKIPDIRIPEIKIPGLRKAEERTAAADRDDKKK